MSGASGDAGPNYLFRRWEELTDTKAPWWSRSEGIGLRLRLQELIEIAEANQAGGIRAETIRDLVAQAHCVFAREGSYCKLHFPEVAAQAEKWFNPKKMGVFIPGGQGPSTAQGCLDQLNAVDYREQVLEDLGKAAATAGKNHNRLAELDELLQLFDAELIADGHAPAWRRDVAADAEKRWHAGEKNVSEVISAALDAAGHSTSPREFAVLIPVRGLVDPPSGRAHLTMISSDQARLLVRDWSAPQAAEILADGDFGTEVVDTTVEAVDAYAAAQKAGIFFARRSGLWQLRDGRVEDPDYAFIYDEDKRAAGQFTLPPEPLALAPPSLDSWARRKAEDRAGGVEDALAQLAQARAATPATALADLWTAAEALFGGVSGDLRYEAGNIMAALAPFSLARDELCWIGLRLTKTGYGTPTVGDEVRWISDVFVNDTKGALAALAGHGDQLAYLRWEQIAAWDKKENFRGVIDELEARLTKVATRAYLIRNAVVHRAEVRGTALAVTLPVFADLVRVCVDHVARLAGPKGTLSEAKFAAMQVQRVAAAFASGAATAPSGLLPLLDPKRPTV